MEFVWENVWCSWIALRRDSLLLCLEAWNARLANRWALGSFGAGPGVE